MKRYFILLFLLSQFMIESCIYAQVPVKVGSKKFTENVILGEIVTTLLKTADIPALHRQQLGGTRVLWNALRKGDIDVYPEYSGTISLEILAGEDVDANDVRAYVAKRGIRMSQPLGFNNTYAIGMKEKTAKKLEITKISDLRKHPDLKFGFTNEFMSRGDGWQSLRDFYNLPQKDVRGLDHDLAYRGLDNGDIQVTDLYSTDAEIEYYNIQTLKDDLHFFPDYDAVLLYRADLEEEQRQAVDAILQLQGQISESEMIQMNADVKIERIPAAQVAADFVRQKFGLSVTTQSITFWDRFRQHTLEHLILVGISLAAAILLSIPLGILAFKFTRVSQLVLGIVGIIQTIPSLALLVFMIPLLGIGAPPAILALFLYSLLPIVRNTYSGLQNISTDIQESAEALGLPSFARLRQIELPLASRSILAGIKTSAVINVGTATLGALIGAGGYGQPILTGIRLDDMGLIFEGAIPAAILALLVQGLFDLSEFVFVPKGLRLFPEK